MMPQPAVGDKVTFRARHSATRFGRILWQSRSSWDVQELPGSFSPGSIHRIALRNISAVNGVGRDD